MSPTPRLDPAPPSPTRTRTASDHNMTKLIELQDGRRPASSCDAKCYNAKSPICDCICNGLNHGVGLQAAIERTRRDGARYVAQYVKDHPFAERWKLKFHLPPIEPNQPLLF